MRSSSTKVLLVEDNRPDAQYTKELLPVEDYTFLEADTLAQALTCVSSQHVDVVLLDLSLPDSHGLQTLRQLVSKSAIPIVVLTGLEDIEVAIETLKLGACDYIVKNRLTPEALARSISYAIESTKRALIEAQLVEAEQRLRLALEGSHTGTWVRLLEGGQFLCDDQAKALFGADDSFGHTFDEFLKFVHPEDKELLVQDTMACSKEREHEYRVIWPDGSTHWIASRGKAARDEKGKLVRSAGICVDISARKQAEKQRSELAAIVESSDAGIIGKTLDGIVTSWNHAAERIFGYRADEMLGKNISILSTPVVGLEMAAIHARVMSGECIDQYESQRIRKDGVTIDCASTISPLKNEHGTIIGMSNIVRDITDRKGKDRLTAVQNAVTILLLESASLVDAAPKVLRLVAESMHWSIGQMWAVDPSDNVLRNIGIWHEPHGDYRDFGAVSRHLTFAEGKDSLGRAWQNQEPEWNVDMSDVSIFSRALYATKSNLRFGCSFPVMQGSVLGVIEFFSSQPSELDADVHTMMTRVCSQLWQFMNRKLAEETINQSLYAQRTIAQAILENAPIGIAKLNKNLQFHEVNSAFSRQFGISGEKLPGKSIFEVTTGLPVEELLAVVRSGTTFRVENVRIVFQGVPADTIAQDTCWDLAAWPILDTSDHIVGVILITADATERAQLARQREDFVATLTHDLKNPLIGQTQVLTMFIAGALGPVQTNQLEALSLLNMSTVGMLDLIGNLLEIYRYDAGAQQLRLEKCDMQEIVDSCFTQAAPFAEQKGINLKSSIGETSIVVDRRAIGRVLTNLLDNAIKFARPETDIEVSCVSTELTCVLRIRDRGCGISKQQLPALFKRFSQTESGQNIRASTGLGLYLCRQIVEAHGGTISCESEASVWTSFYVSLPGHGTTANRVNSTIVQDQDSLIFDPAKVERN